MSDATLLAKLEEAEARAEQKAAELERAREQLRGVLKALPVEYCVTFTGDYAAYTRAIVQLLLDAPIIPAPLAGYEHVLSGETVCGDLFWMHGEAGGWTHVHRDRIDVRDYPAVIRKKKV